MYSVRPDALRPQPVGWLEEQVRSSIGKLAEEKAKGETALKAGRYPKRVDVVVRRGGCYYDMFGFGHLIATILIWQKSGDRYTKI